MKNLKIKPRKCSIKFALTNLSGAWWRNRRERSSFWHTRGCWLTTCSYSNLMQTFHRAHQVVENTLLSFKRNNYVHHICQCFTARYSLRKFIMLTILFAVFSTISLKPTVKCCKSISSFKCIGPYRPKELVTFVQWFLFTIVANTFGQTLTECNFFANFFEWVFRKQLTKNVAKWFVIFNHNK